MFDTVSLLSADPRILLATLACVLPFAGAFFVGLGTRKSAKYISSVFAALSLVACLALAVLYYQQGAYRVATAGITVSSGLFGMEPGSFCEVLGINIDMVSTLLAPAFVGIGFLVLIYSGAYLNMENREHADPGMRRFYALLSIFIGAMAGLAYSSTLVGQLIFFEITGACSYGLIGYYMSKVSQHSAMKALIITHVASLGLYIAAGLVFVNTGSFALEGIATLPDGLKTGVLICILFAAWGKSAQLPMYMWLPSAMEAPTPTSAYLHGGSMVKVGVFVFARAVMMAGEIPHALGYVALVGAVLTLYFSFMLYLPQTDMKRLLAYSTISQLSYIFLALALASFGSHLAFNGAIAHIFNHAFAKTLFFLVAGALSFMAGTRILTRIRGLGKKQPLTAVAFVCAALAVAGVPPFSGFFSKFMIFAGGFEVAGGNPTVLVVLVLALIETILCFAWFLKWIGFCIPGEPSPEVAASAKLPAGMGVVFVVLIVMTVASSGLAAWWLG